MSCSALPYYVAAAQGPWVVLSCAHRCLGVDSCDSAAGTATLERVLLQGSSLRRLLPLGSDSCARQHCEAVFNANPLAVGSSVGTHAIPMSSECRGLAALPLDAFP